MSLSGFILELLVPGLVVALGVALIAAEFELWSANDPTSLSATIVISAVLVISYLGGIAIRHATYRLVLSSGACYLDRLLTKWEWTIPELRNRYLVEAESSNHAEAELIGVQRR